MVQTSLMLRGKADMTMNQLTEQEQVLVSAFRNMHPEKKDIMVDMATDLAKDFIRNGPKLTLVSGSPTPLTHNPFSRAAR
jgi:hypothetical protein